MANLRNELQDETQLCLDWPRLAIRCLEAPHATLLLMKIVQHFDKYDALEMEIIYNSDALGSQNMEEEFRKNWAKMAPDIPLEDFRYRLVITPANCAEMTTETMEWDPPTKIKELHYIQKAEFVDPGKKEEKDTKTEKMDVDGEEDKSKSNKAKQSKPAGPPRSLPWQRGKVTAKATKEEEEKEEEEEDEDEEEEEDEDLDYRKWKDWKKDEYQSYHKSKKWNWYDKKGGKDHYGHKDFYYREKYGAWPSGNNKWKNHQQWNNNKGGWGSGAWKSGNNKKSWNKNDWEDDKEERKWRSWIDWQEVKKEEKEGRKWW
eukprot:TRINITY_DN26135_c0_g1_i8.p1 TRINITY_DN26135_c0_g1~~TRINITY_DN26135_c0_g1_i8.p1  ORF type:complete len:325 (-),score=118.23 TRINITY_DN26135_c0_g1_i8:139-1086(-)